MPRRIILQRNADVEARSSRKQSTHGQQSRMSLQYNGEFFLGALCKAVGTKKTAISRRWFCHRHQLLVNNLTPLCTLCSSHAFLFVELHDRLYSVSVPTLFAGSAAAAESCPWEVSIGHGDVPIPC
jgi:hypothetical protein